VGDTGGLRDDISKLWNDIYYGNGKPGMVTRVQSLENAVDRIEATLADFKKAVYWLLTLVLGAVILQIVNLVVKH
jgi:hypothetical protein